jgi:RimJ/RimL family protein N-acetyltransferase
MEKIGMQKESVLKQHIKKGEEYYDIVMYSIVKK